MWLILTDHGAVAQQDETEGLLGTGMTVPSDSGATSRNICQKPSRVIWKAEQGLKSRFPHC